MPACETESQHNAPLHLFSAAPDIVRFGAQHFAKQSTESSNLINDLLSHYQIEGIDMPYTMADYRREKIKELLDAMTPQERMRYLRPEELLDQLPPEVRLKGLLPEERLKGLPPDERLKGLPAEERLKGLTAEEILRSLPEEVVQALLRRLGEQNRDSNGGQSDEQMD